MIAQRFPLACRRGGFESALILTGSALRKGVTSGEQAGLAGLDLQAEILGVDAGLGETAGDEPEAGLPGAHEHVAQLLVIAESPDRADASGNIIAKQFANLMFLAFVAGRQHD